MEMSGFTEEQLTVKDAITKICANFPNEYWRDHDESGTDPWELHAALAKDGWLGIALPEELGGAGLGKKLFDRRSPSSPLALTRVSHHQAFPRQQ